MVISEAMSADSQLSRSRGLPNRSTRRMLQQGLSSGRSIKRKSMSQVQLTLIDSQRRNHSSSTRVTSMKKKTLDLHQSRSVDVVHVTSIASNITLHRCTRPWNPISSWCHITRRGHGQHRIAAHTTLPFDGPIQLGPHHHQQSAFSDGASLEASQHG